MDFITSKEVFIQFSCKVKLYFWQVDAITIVGTAAAPVCSAGATAIAVTTESSCFKMNSLSAVGVEFATVLNCV